jgi:serine/threonine protein kinase
MSIHLDIILTVNPFVLPDPIDPSNLPTPLVKLTDFGLARFIDPERPMLTTRCGSESYAAPEIVMGQTYDGRQTDAWACGIVLYALAVRTLPFDSKGEDNGRGSHRRYLVRIAKCEYSWPEDPVEGRLATDDLKKVVGRLLVRDPAKRARIVDLWDEEFMRSQGAPSPPWRIAARRNKTNQGRDSTLDPNQTPTMENVPEEDEMEVDEEDEYDDAMLVDAHDISSIASQELL